MARMLWAHLPPGRSESASPCMHVYTPAVARLPRDEACLRAAQRIVASRCDVAVRDSGVSHAYPGTKFVLVRRSASFQPASSVALRDSGMSGS